MVEAQFALSVAFLTVAIPLALDARWTSAAWALQGAAMVWLGFRQQRRLALAAGIVLQLLSGAAYVDQVGAPAEWAVLNGRFLGAFLLALAGGFSGRLFEAPRRCGRRALRRARSRRTLAFPLVSGAFLLWASAWWIWAGVAEIDRFVSSRFELAAYLLFFGGTTLLAMTAAARASWPRLNALGLVLWPAAIFLAVLAVFEVSHPDGTLRLARLAGGIRGDARLPACARGALFRPASGAACNGVLARGRAARLGSALADGSRRRRHLAHGRGARGRERRSC